ncbi:MAG: serine/threonine-protein kinase, partial [Myxococcota bacterium]
MPERFGRYWLHEQIGHGGMAEIFRATVGPDPESYAFDLALKRMHAPLEKDRSRVEMFFTEADVAKFLHHPNLVRVYEAGLIEGRAYIAMESIWGHDLSKLIAQLRRRRLRFPSDLAIFVTLQLLRALDYVHRAKAPGGVEMNLVHRDVTPSNIYVTFGGEVKLGDFGVAHISFLEPHESSGTVKGKVGYMPPEVISGDPVDQAVDVWGAAVTLYEMLTTRGVYGEVSDEDLIAGIEPPPVTPLHKVNSDIELALSKILSRALHRNPKKRPRNAVQFYRHLKLYLRDTGIVVDSSALARFVWEITGAGASPMGPKPKADTGQFAMPDYQAPLEQSPTQRFEAVSRRRRRLPFLIVGGLVVAAIVVVLVRGSPPPQTGETLLPPSPIEQPDETPPPSGRGGAGFDFTGA